ncbi:OsmC family protein [Actinosynnema sp. NPDC020468]|uniref:OsmC family protein n=1 Tax=Actinosynnema sp. NPDC020468 TaxID=3154488 RepID=UPI003406E9D1
MVAFEVGTRTLQGESTAIGHAGPFTLTVDRSVRAGGGGLGFGGGQLLYLAVAACVSNDLFREAEKEDIVLHRVEVTVSGEFGAVSGPVGYAVDVEGDASDDRLRALVSHVDALAEVPNSLRAGTEVRLTAVTIS